jgi:hypothetical protein
VGITFSRLSLSYWIDNLGFITEGKLVAIFIKTFSWGFPTGRSFLLHQLGPIRDGKGEIESKPGLHPRLLLIATLFD